jgi:hypothetical protein
VHFAFASLILERIAKIGNHDDDEGRETVCQGRQQKYIIVSLYERYKV